MRGSPTCSCGRRLAPVPLPTTATEVRRRTCRGCGIRWQVTVRPLAGWTGPGRGHEVTLVGLNPDPHDDREGA